MRPSNPTSSAAASAVARGYHYGASTSSHSTTHGTAATSTATGRRITLVVGTTSVLRGRWGRRLSRCPGGGFRSAGSGSIRLRFVAGQSAAPAPSRAGPAACRMIPESGP